MTAPFGLSRSLQPGDPFPWIETRARGHSRFAVDPNAGRYLVLCFFGSMTSPASRRALSAVEDNRALFDNLRFTFFGVSIDPEDEAQNRVSDKLPGVQLWDFDAKASRECRFVDQNAEQGHRTFRQNWVVVDPTLHVLGVFPFKGDDDDHAEVFAFLKRLPAPDGYAGFEIPAPVLVLPNVFEQDLCRELIRLYDEGDPIESGVVRDDAGVLDASFKRRRDFTITDQALILALQKRIVRRVVPEISKLFFMTITRMERHMVGCYAAEDGGHFQPHRDNDPGMTAHRRFAVSINLNADFEGGAVRFPEYNRRGIKAPPGWAVVFPCAILHAVSKVTSGRRYAFLPFVYDETGAKLRDANHQAAAA